MAWKIDTSTFPNIQRNPFAYEATIVSIEGKHGQASGEPFVSIVWDSPMGKRFSKIFCKNKWFTPEFRGPQDLEAGSKEHKLFARSIGVGNRKGDIDKLLGGKTPVVEGFNEMIEILENTAVGKKFWVVETQDRNEDGTPGDGYNLSIRGTEKPTRVPANTKFIEREESFSAN